MSTADKDNIADAADAEIDDAVNAIIGDVSSDVSGDVTGNVSGDVSGDVSSDNNAPAPITPAPMTPEPTPVDPRQDEIDQYMKQFDRVSTGLIKLRENLIKVKVAKATHERLSAAIDYITCAHTHFEDVNDLLVEMSNFFGRA